MASLSKRTIETLTDLVEIKLSCFQVYDRDDARELAALERARRELAALGPAVKAVVPFRDSDESGEPVRAAG